MYSYFLRWNSFSIKNISIRITFVFLVAYSLIYGESNKKEISLSEILILAEKNSPLLMSMNSDLESLYYRKKQEGMTQNPSVTIDYGQRRAANESGSEYSFQFEQPIYYPGRKELKQLLVDNDAKIKEVQFEEANNSIRLNSIKFAYRYFIADKKRNHVKERNSKTFQDGNLYKGKTIYHPTS